LQLLSLAFWVSFPLQIRIGWAAEVSRVISRVRDEQAMNEQAMNEQVMNE
jgi:hypothetical protein